MKLKNLRAITLKVHEPTERDAYRMIVMNKDDTMAQFMDKIAETCEEGFCGAGYFDALDKKNVRLRQYDTRLKVK